MVPSGIFRQDYGLEGDAHAESGLRQVSLLTIEDIEKAETQSKSSEVDFRPGIFAENITTEHIDLSRLRVGDKIALGDEVILEITQLGKECHATCSIGAKVGRCIMPCQGVFASVQRGGVLRVNDAVRALESRVKKGFFSWLKI